jgi:hypothetical protein
MRTIGGMPGRRLVCRNPFRAPAIYRLSYTMEEAKHRMVLNSLRPLSKGREYEAICPLCPRIAPGVLNRHL